jgi:formylglycine-generating enzyme required for sulfatase activity
VPSARPKNIPKKRPRDEPQLPSRPDTPRILSNALLDVCFWQLQARERFPDRVSTERPAPAPYQGWRNRPERPPRFQPLATWAELAPRLRRVLSDYREARAIDLDRTVQRLSRGRILEGFPRERRRRWGPTLLLIEDDSRRLIPYRADKRLIRAAVRRLLPAHAVSRAVIDDGLDRPLPLYGDPGGWLPPPGTLVLALGDLGCLAVHGARLRERWLEIGRDLRDAGCYPLVLFPAPAARCPPELADVWRLIPWERPRLAEDGRTPAERADRLLRLVAPASRIEPGLLRAARLLLPPEQADAGTEADVWQHRALISDSAAGATMDPKEARALRRAFAREEPLALRRPLIRLIKTWRGDLPAEIWFDELLNADREALQSDPDRPADPFGRGDLEADLDDARSYMAAFCDENPSASAPSMPASDRAWVARLEARSTEHLWKDPVVGARLAELAIELTRNEATSDLPPGIGPGDIDAHDRPERRSHIVQTGPTLQVVSSLSATDTAWSLLADISSPNRLIEIRSLDEEQDANAFWEAGRPPSWAADWGRDEHGAWVELSVKSKGDEPVVQRMRWIEPGSFQMGSPGSESERYEDEGPRHEVRIEEGFWLFDTACTQAFWEAVMGENPSRFEGPRRPVEQVSWNDAQRFIATLNERVPGLGLGLPSEAQWEYACRAGTDTALYTGPIDILGQNNAPALDPIAWYAGNSGVGFELEYGYDSSGWPELQYPNPKSGTHPVGKKRPNPQGLYDMIGNVIRAVVRNVPGSF